MPVLSKPPKGKHAIGNHKRYKTNISRFYFDWGKKLFEILINVLSGTTSVCRCFHRQNCRQESAILATMFLQSSQKSGKVSLRTSESFERSSYLMKLLLKKNSTSQSLRRSLRSIGKNVMPLNNLQRRKKFLGNQRNKNHQD